MGTIEGQEKELENVKLEFYSPLTFAIVLDSPTLMEVVYEGNNRERKRAKGGRRSGFIFSHAKEMDSRKGSSLDLLHFYRPSACNRNDQNNNSTFYCP